MNANTTQKPLTEEELQLAAMQFDPAFDEATADDMERGASDPNNGINRRIALSVLRKGKADLVANFGKDDGARELLEESIRQLGGYIDHLKAVTETVTAARDRLLVVAYAIAVAERKAPVVPAAAPPPTPAPPAAPAA